MVPSEHDLDVLLRRVTVVIVTYNSRSSIDLPLRALAVYGAAGSLRCIVVDNQSSDGTAEYVSGAYPWVETCRAGRNLGFGRGCNVGLRLAQSDYTLLLNPDAALRPAELCKLLRFMDSHPRAGICGPAIEYGDGTLQPAGGLPTPLRVVCRPLAPNWSTRGRFFPKSGDPPQTTDYVSGCIFLLRARLVAEIGAFDPRYFLYFEETDLCRRAVAAGWEVWTVGQAVGTHVGGVSAKSLGAPLLAGMVSRHFFQSRYYYLVKHFGVHRAALAELGEFLTLAVRAGVNWARGRACAEFRARLRCPPLRLPARRT